MSEGALGRLSHLWALDTTYRASDAAWMAWLRSRDGLHLTVIYRDATYEDPKTKVRKRVPTGFHGEKFLRLADKSNGRLSATKVAAGKVRHCNIPKAYLPGLLDSLPAVSAKAEGELDAETYDDQTEDLFTGTETESEGDEEMTGQYAELESWDDETDELEAAGEEEASLEAFGAFADSETDEDEEVEEIRSFQLANGVSASGEVDAATRAAFVAALSRISKPSAAPGTSFYEQTIRKHPLFDSPKRIADMELLEPVTRERVRAIIRDAADQGIKLMVWETYRSKARQEELFKRGTTKLRAVGVHHYGLACDLVKNVNGEPSWKGDFKFMEALARANKLVWGGDWGIAGKKPKFYDPVHVQRCSLSRQSSLFKGTWYPSEDYDPFTS